MFNMILFGPPGSGKGTQAERLIQKYSLMHTSTGDLLRNEIAEKTPLGMEAKKFMDKGLLVPDEVVIGMISSKLDENLTNPAFKGFIFDGFPRTEAQAEALDKLLDFKKTSVCCVVALIVSEEELMKRLVKRGEVSTRPDDQDPEIIRKRIVEYNQKTAPVAEYYKKRHKYTAINGEQSMDETFLAICKVIDKINVPVGKG